MYYLRDKGAGDFEFLHIDLHEISPQDAELTDGTYEEIRTKQSQGKQFRLKSVVGSKFEDIFEEIAPPPEVLSALGVVQKEQADLIFTLMMNGVL
ncbi:hypothetical protein [Bacillus sp. T33-2]|uniref:hypothetical protein n=1 Tax=Bacillus sp. T33-2 TaxID=2054168 RepID=UPI000C78160E|nr:hypothetical protein [Bacillus sp. T33-2]PLR93185.1 hypothetical protein CVD19_19450 [Bacillus sp. T33-2]